MLHIFNKTLLSHKKEWNHTICSNMDGSTNFNLSTSEREKTSITWYPLYMASQIWHEETYLQYGSRLTDTEGRLEAATRRRGLVTRRTESLGFSRCKVIYTGRGDKKILLYSTEKYMQYSEKMSIRKDSEKEWILVCLCLNKSHWYAPETHRS